MGQVNPTIIYTRVDEAPALATYSFLPIVQAFTKQVNVDVQNRNISLASRIIAKFNDILNEDQRLNDDLAYLGGLVHEPEGNIIKLPNISATIPQLKACIAELQSKGYKLPDYPENPTNDEEKTLHDRYATCLGSAVNPILREGNSDRRAALAVKNYAKKHPHKLLEFAKAAKTCVAYMDKGDFYGNEQSIIKKGDGKVTIELNGEVLKEIDALDKEILDATFMSALAFRDFIAKTLRDAKEKGLLWSIHLKATMMKVSDPIMFGHALSVFFNDVFKAYAPEFASIDVNPNLGLGDLFKKLDALDADKRAQIDLAFTKQYDSRPNIAMVNSDKGITNLHASNDIIIDASIPVVIRNGGTMWNKEGNLQECMLVIPDRSYATLYEECIKDCEKNGQFDVTTMGSVANVGLMAQKAEEYGSHPTTFEISRDGIVEVKDSDGTVLMSSNVQKGDIWRMSRAKDIPIKDWIRLAYERGKLTGEPIVFWLDSNRPHDANMIGKIVEYLPSYLAQAPIEFHILSPQQAMKFSLKRIRKGLNTISVAGNIIRDYLTDLFPIIELGTSAKMLSIVPLLAGGGLFETGAGGSAPKHVKQFLEEGHLRWDSLGEFLALAESLRYINQKHPSKKLEALVQSLDKANAMYLDNDKSPSRKVGEPDNKASHFYLAKYWAESLGDCNVKELSDKFTPIAKALQENEDEIIEELLRVEGEEQDIGGYYKPSVQLASKAMRPSITLNKIIDSI